ncbi:hypothetical protein [Variovorax ginsengisoli]|uniref:Uncharacterized protein n=1 Tax=Variovorax ginsengisoli TaxID=363844 RepID=A0ABT8SF56_9BURK|nr:hypothetical protein [Variovorax ginsengisoli]MDN8617833.1 hypothetical protein [Variovorax ginsengisoli]MDO1537003.1 hypothetical protein [Variovorax ginsengisoli]
MRRAQAWLRRNGEFALSAGLFLGCVYAAVFYVVEGALGAAGFAAFLAYGFFHASAAFHDAAVMRRAMRMDEGTDDVEC